MEVVSDSIVNSRIKILISERPLAIFDNNDHSTSIDSDDEIHQPNPSSIFPTQGQYFEKS